MKRRISIWLYFVSYYLLFPVYGNSPQCVCSVSLEQDVLPHVGSSLVPDELVRTVGKTLQQASRLYELDVTRLRRQRALAHKRSFTSSVVSEADFTPPSTPPEARFDPDFDRQARRTVKGTTVEIVEVGRERFAYWSFELLFSLCSDEDQGASDCVYFLPLSLCRERFLIHRSR